jgi:hypothetical protein
MENRKVFQHLYSYKSSLLLLLTVLSLLLAACGGDQIPTIAGPPPTPTPSFKQEANQDLFFVMSVPATWNKTSEKDAITFTAPEDGNVRLTITSVVAPKLTADSTRILQEELDKRKTRFSQFRQDNAGLINLVDSNVNLYKVTYFDASTEISEYLAQINVPLAERAYILSGRALAATAEQRKSTFVSSFQSFKSNAPLTVPATLTAAAGGDSAANSAGAVTGDKTSPGKVNTLVDWTSPALLYGPTKFTVEGLFPQNWQWRIKSFPGLDPSVLPPTPTAAVPGSTPAPAPGTPAFANPGLYFTAPNNEAFIQVGIVPNAFPTEAPPSTDDYKKAIEPYLKSFNLSLAGLGSRNSTTELANVGTFFRTTFVARGDNGVTNARGVVLFRSEGRHLVMSVVTLGPTAALKQNLIDGYDADIQSIASSVKVTKQ